MRPTALFQYCCKSCGQSTATTYLDLLVRLRQSGFLRRDKDPSIEFVSEVLAIAAKKWHCPQCEAANLTVERIPEEAEWREGRACSGCGKQILVERLEVFPNANYCAACESRPPKERDDDPQFCLRCGSKMEVQRSRRTGIARYVFACPICPARS